MAKQKIIKKNTQIEQEEKMPLGRRNYIWLLIGLILLLLGFGLMVGGGSDDPTAFNDKMFNFRRITLAPIVVIAGFVVEIYAIMSKRK